MDSVPFIFSPPGAHLPLCLRREIRIAMFWAVKREFFFFQISLSHICELCWVTPRQGFEDFFLILTVVTYKQLLYRKGKE